MRLFHKYTNIIRMSFLACWTEVIGIYEFHLCCVCRACPIFLLAALFVVSKSKHMLNVIKETSAPEKWFEQHLYCTNASSTVAAMQQFYHLQVCMEEQVKHMLIPLTRLSWISL